MFYLQLKKSLPWRLKQEEIEYNLGMDFVRAHTSAKLLERQLNTRDGPVSMYSQVPLALSYASVTMDLPEM